MKLALLIAGIAFLFLAFVMLVASVGIFLYARKKRAAAAGRPAAAAAPSVTPHTPVASPSVPPRATVPVDDPDRTVFVSTPRAGSLACVSGPLAGQTFDIEPNGSWIGRDRASAQIVIEDGRVSKRHVWVGFRQGTLTAVDNSSTNGTYINDAAAERITEVALSPGDVIIISDDVARFEYRA